MSNKFFFFFFSSRRRHTRSYGDWSSDVCSSDLTIALELAEQAPLLEALIAPVGGGGLISGLAIAAKAINPKMRVFAAEPLGADDAARSKTAGKLIPQTAPKTVADGLLTSLGEIG